MEDPERNNKAEKKPTSEEYKQETEQLLKFHRQDQILAPSLFLKILEVYLLFVATVGGIGVAASQGHHDTTSGIFFVAAVVLVLIVPFAVIWYLLGSVRKSTAAENEPMLWVRFTQSSIGRSWLLISSNRVFRLISFLINFAAAVYMIAFAIIRFHLHPRMSLAIIVMYVVLFLTVLILEIVRSVEVALRRDIKEIWEFEARTQVAFSNILEIIKHVDAKATSALGIAESARKFLEDTEPSHVEMHKSTSNALSAIQHFMEVTANIVIKSDQVGAPPGEDKDNKG